MERLASQVIGGRDSGRSRAPRGRRRERVAELPLLRYGVSQLTGALGQ